MDKPIVKLNQEVKINNDAIKGGKSIYNAIVISVDDEIDSGRIKAKIIGLDGKLSDNNIPWAYPLLPRFIHLFPKVGEVVRIFIEDTKYPYNMRYWIGNIISQYPKINFDSYSTALSTTPISPFSPDKSIYKNPNAKFVFPDKNEIGIIGRKNTDIILKDNNVVIRAGKHENDNIFQLNEKNPAMFHLGFNNNPKTNNMISNGILFGDKIALISHDGNPKYNSTNNNTESLIELYQTAHPMVRGDLLVDVLNVMRNAIIEHLHGYSNMPADKNSIIKSLENLTFENILQKNIVIN